MSETLNREKDEKERDKMDVAQLVRLPNGEKVVMGSTLSFHIDI